MKYDVYYLNFSTPLHIGNGNLVDAEQGIFADTIFSALCIEALKQGGLQLIQYLVEQARENQLVLSDAMPHIKNELWITKPYVQVNREQDGDSIIKKSFKKLRYVSLAKIQTYLNGNLDPEEENKKMKTLGKASIQTRSSLREGEDALPYNVGTYTFAEGNGLYIIVGYETSEIEHYFETLLAGLSYNGIGGKVSSGLGKFDYRKIPLEKEIVNKINTDGKNQITLSISLPKQAELETVIKDAKYKLIKRGGFIQSTNYAKTMQKRRTLFMFQSGSHFSEKFEGDVYDVSENGTHPVYRYGKPMFFDLG